MNPVLAPVWRRQGNHEAPDYIYDDGAMNSYLSIAAKVLLETRQPLSARQILEAAYRLQIVPEQLFGKTQHKTLGARLSVEILQHGIKSEFVRTGPGRYFLRSLLENPATPERHRKEYFAPIRSTQLRRFDVLTFSRDAIATLSYGYELIPLEKILTIRGTFHQLSDLRKKSELIPLQIFVILTSENKILFRGKATSDGRGQAQPALGIVDFIRRDDRSLFSRDSVGLHEAATRAISEQLRLPYHRIVELEPDFLLDEVKCLVTNGEIEGERIVALLPYKAPQSMQSFWFGDCVEWEELPLRINDLESLDYCSRLLLERQQTFFNLNLH